jgi:hypothetical protein
VFLVGCGLLSVAIMRHSLHQLSFVAFVVVPEQAREVNSPRYPQQRSAIGGATLWSVIAAVQSEAGWDCRFAIGFARSHLFSFPLLASRAGERHGLRSGRDICRMKLGNRLQNREILRSGLPPSRWKFSLNRNLFCEWGDGCEGRRVDPTSATLNGQVGNTRLAQGDHRSMGRCAAGRYRAVRVGVAIAAFAMLANCSMPGRYSNNAFDPRYGVSTSARVVAPGDPVPKGGGVYRVGQPYVVAGQTYVPEENTRYRAEGVASWYGADFHGRQTANGEVFDMHAISAAHPTLPMPCYARVTNLANGRSLIVRVNDRGP